MGDACVSTRACLGPFWLPAVRLPFLLERRAWRCRKLKRNLPPGLCATCKPTRSCRGVLTPWPATFRNSVMSACLYFEGITLARVWPGRTPSSRWPVAVHRTSLRLLCHNAENLNARSARHLLKTSDVSCESLDFLVSRTYSRKLHNMSSKCVSPSGAKELILRTTRYLPHRLLHTWDVNA